jgi:Ca2+-binding RTX toxin-like protein
MYGGLGNDTYYINYGEGADEIIDTQGRNEIIYKGLDGKEQIIDNFYALPSGPYKTADGKGILTHNSPWQIVFDDGTVIELGEGCTPKNFGMTLITLPTNPDIDNTINGTDQGWRDDPGDDFYDTLANDEIFALGGDDYVLCDVGGANWISGGEGYDNIDGENSSSTIIEGGAGSDILIGGVNGNNQLFGDSRGGDGDLSTVMATHIANGETALDSGTRGDIVAADGENNNYLFGSNGYDIMWGHSGKDVIVAGGGNDLIIGDGHAMLAAFDDLYTWSFHIEYNGNTYIPVITGLTAYDMESSVDNDDAIYDGTGNDFVVAGGGADEVYGGTGNDSMQIGADRGQASVIRY